tara:strand:+ start:130 stop:864 length:735 start_codon:yes stop_codon:yes gene_type:complete
MNKSLTILFIPDNGERTYEFKLGRSLIGLILSIVSFSVILLGFGLNGIYKVERLQNQITGLKSEVLFFKSQEEKIIELEQMLLRLQKSNQKLRSILGTDDVGRAGIPEVYDFSVYDRIRWGHIESVPSLRPITGVFGDLNVRYREPVFIPATRGTPVRATANGSIRSIRYNREHGRQIVVDHGNTLLTQYGYLSHVFVSQGEWVIKGQNIGLSGISQDRGLEGLEYALVEGASLLDPRSYWLWQ